MKKDSNPHSVATVMETCDVLAGTLSGKSRTPRVISCDFLSQPPQFACAYRANLLKIINHDHPLTVQKD